MAGANPGYPAKKTNDAWTDKHRNALTKLAVEEGWVQRRLHDIGWSDKKKWRGCHKEESTEKHRLYHCSYWKEVRNQIREKLANVTKRPRFQRKTEIGRETSRRTL